ncbi:MAG TPA: hypothetical protein VFH70_09845 [Acidimicrobiales bacterium]|nr:hypothetical protein [Acidimicrobiales bacterium]
MSALQSVATVDRKIRLHPSVGLSLNPTTMTAPQKVAAVAMVRCLERDLLDGDRVRRALSRDQAEHLVIRINDLRTALGWLEINLDGKWRWPEGSI